MNLDSILTAIRALPGTHADLTALLSAARAMAEEGEVAQTHDTRACLDSIVDAVIGLDDGDLSELVSYPEAYDFPREVMRDGH